MMKALIADKMPTSGRAALEQAGIEVTFSPELTADSLLGAIGDHAILIVRSTKVNAAVFDHAKSLQLIVRAGAGTNNIDVAKANSLGVYVANCPGKNAIAVAELTMGLLISLDRRIAQANAEMKRGIWNKKEFSKADGLYGRTHGVIGVGNIGKEVITRAQALGMNVVAWSRSLTDAEAERLGVTRAQTPIDLAKMVDSVSLHLARNDDTIGLIDKGFLTALPERAMVINASRNGIVDESALLHAMESRGIRYATDVYNDEPGSGTDTIENALATHPLTVCTPHIGASTEQSQQAVSTEAVRVVTNFAATGEVSNCVNLCAHSPAKWQLNVRHLDQVGVLASILSTIRAAGTNVEELENIIFADALAACARIRLDDALDDDTLGLIAKTEHVIDAKLIAL